MNIFQNSVLNKYLKMQDEKKIDEAYSQLTAYFHNAEIQQNIRNSKEEQFQEGFLRALFVKILGYTLNPQPNFNLTTELKNEKGAKKTDGAILKNGKALAVIELKGTETKDLDKVNNQAFNYKNNHTDCIYVITSNFEKLRFFIHDAVAHIEFNLFTLTKEDFKILWLCLNAENLLGGVPAKIKQDSIIVEENVTKQLYKDYSTFKNELWQNICKNRPDLDKLLLFKKTQKLLDRFLFVFFSEDSGLLPPNSIYKMVERYEQLIELDAQKPLYDIFKQFFGYINKGQEGKTAHDDIFAYNGGLFQPDELLDGLIIDDEILKPHVLTMTAYNFQSDIDVNILGHIFENSLNEIENVTAQLEGQKVDKSKSKRKKDGVFYTPKYITKYIVENTVGKLCEEKKVEFGIVDEEYAKGQKKRRKAIVKTLYDNLQEYRNWLLEITICDPACGSGAFLNQALEFLISEHAYIDELQANLLESSIVFQDVSNHVLEKNIFGVDINEESVDIAKLSLWLRTAQRGRKLTSLNNNIKCGNSLIDAPEVAGEKAFNWQNEFPQIFEKGGFDVVIGNPPYVESNHITTKEKSFYYKIFKTAENRMNLYGLFIEKSINIIKADSIYGLIIPNYWLSTDYDLLLRKKVFIENYALSVFNTYQVFTDAVVDTVLLIGKKCIPLKETNLISINRNLKTINERLQAIGNQLISYQTKLRFDSFSDLKTSFSTKISIKSSIVLSDLFIVSLGIVPYREGMGMPPQTKEMCKDKIFHSIEKIDISYLPLIGAKQVQRYILRPPEFYIKYGANLAEPRTERLFNGNRLLVNRILGKNHVNATYCDDTAVNNSDGFNLVPKSNDEPLKAILSIIASRFCVYYFRSTNVNLDRAAFPKLNVKTLASFPLPKFNNESVEILSCRADSMLSLNKKLQTEKNNFLNTLKEEKGIEKITKKLDAFYETEYDAFKKELAKQKIKISLGSENNEWREYFNTTTQKINELQTQINQTDKEIDKMVYELYELTPEEIEIVENSVK
ncbi:DNA methyltransferase [Candidatus Parabeggiatoa sp. HSG14]|uniref:Eco57I restriction-modification methylase domain-containing protein n=1 Tax=Candidatus Parabeggiatoa sp. HSG14 TaxID=3055593 RepID=UPI0025A7EF76|nr:N-6 DNA methylase [Thiotrichales bacterium HSG14]